MTIFKKKHSTISLGIGYFALLCISTFSYQLVAQPLQNPQINRHKPKVVIGIVVDQMRWDYLYQFEKRYKEEGAFKRLLKEGYECKNTHIGHIPTVTAAGHASIYTGTTPAINGIVGNNWYDSKAGKKMYCTESTQHNVSPENMWVTTMSDELRINSKFKNRSFGVAIKDRGAVLPAGHTANAAFWYNSKTGNWVTSSYYGAAPKWLESFNSQEKVDDYYAKGWRTLYPLASYTKHNTDYKNYEHSPFSKNEFPYTLKQYQNKSYEKIASTPWGNSFTLDFAKYLIEKEHIGKTPQTTDFLSISFSSTDYIGHAFGPNSVEIEDTYLRLDKELGEFMSYLDDRLGKGNYLLFLSSDHGVSHIPQYLEEHRLPGGVIHEKELVAQINRVAKEKIGIDSLVVTMQNAQLYLNNAQLSQRKINVHSAIGLIKEILYQQNSQILFVVNNLSLQNEPIPTSIKLKISAGYQPKRSGEVSIIFKPGYVSQWITGKGTTHFSPYSYDTHIPLVFYGWNIVPGSTNRQVSMTDIAPTVCSLLDIQMPSGNTGTPIYELFANQK